MKKLNVEGSMVRSYSAGELPAGSYRMFVKGDFNGINNSASDGFTTLPAIYQIGSTDTKKEIKKEQLSTLEDGWNYAVDEDKKFWKDDFSSNTIANYYGSGTNGVVTYWSWENGGIKFTTNSTVESISNQVQLGSGIYKGIFRLSKLPTATAGQYFSYGLSFAGDNSQTNNYNVRIYFSGTINSYNIALAKARSTQFMTNTPTPTLSNFNPCIPHEIAVEYDAVTRLCIMYLDGVEKGRTTETTLLLGGGFFGVYASITIADSPVVMCEELTFIPKTAYSDGMTVDATARYQAISGTNAFNTDKIVMTATPVAWNKTRLKSYKFESGRFRQKITLPTAGTVNDIVAHFFNCAADGLTNYGVGVKRLSTNLWLPVEIKDNVIVNTGISPIVPIQDGNTVILEVEADTIRGVSWLSVWKDGSSNIMTFDGVNDKIILSNINLTNFTAKSVFIWCKIPSFTGTGRTIYDAGYWTSTYGDLFQISGGSNNITLYTKNSSGTTINKPITFIPDTWCCIGYAWDGTTVTYYINGSQYSTTNSLSGTLACSSYPPVFGVNTTGTNPFDGVISSVRIYNRGLSASEVMDLYKGTSISSGLVGDFVNTGNTNADWINRVDLTASTVSGTPATVAITGIKAQSTTLKQFAPYQTAHTATGYYNAGAGDNAVALKLLECRTRSLLGYTNVPVTEAIVINDDFNENSIGKYTVVTGTPTVSGGVINMASAGLYCAFYTKNMFGDGEYIVKWKNPDLVNADSVGIWICCNGIPTSGSYYAPPNGYGFTGICDGTVYAITIKRMVNSTVTTLATGTPITLAINTEHTFRIVKTGSTIQFYVNGSLAASTTDATFSNGYVLFKYTSGVNGTINDVITELKVNATRHSYKPMLRGAGLGSYYDGTTEIQTARFTDDFEYGSADSALTFDSTKWEIVDNKLHKKLGTAYNYLCINACKFANGSYKFIWNPVSVITSSGYASSMFIFCCDSTTLSFNIADPAVTPKGYYITMRTGIDSFTITKRDGTTSILLLGTLTSPISFSIGNNYSIEVTLVNGIIKVYIDELYAGSVTDATPLPAGYCGFNNIWNSNPAGHEYYIKNISVNGVFDSNTKLLGGSEYGGFFLSDGNPVNGGNFAGLKFINHDRDTIYTNTINVGTSPVTDSGGVNYEIIRKNITDNTRISPTKEMVTALPIGAAAAVTTNDITLNTDHANKAIGLYIQTKLDSAPVLQITNQTLARNTLTDTTVNNYYYADFDVGAGATDIGVWETGVGTNYLKMDYMEVVPKGLIEREVNRSLVTLNESKSYVTGENEVFDASSKITFSTSGQTFAPVITVAGNPEILWTFSNGTTSSSTIPSVDFGSTGNRQHTLKVTPWWALRKINVGYNADDEGVAPSPETLVAVTNQNVTGITGLQNATSLEMFAASRNPITSLDFTDLVNLGNIECFSCTNLTNVVLKNVPLLSRVCVEHANLSELDLSDVPLIADIRSALNANPFHVTWGTVGAKVWHICIRANTFAEQYPYPVLSQFPLLRELYVYDDGLTGILALEGSNLDQVHAQNNAFSGITINSNCTALDDVDLTNCGLSETLVDYVLDRLDTIGNVTGELLIAGTNSAPSATGLTHKTNLQNKSWVVTTN